jgi:uncharacterized protein YfaS (alpha-2-macroglobulin family)
MRALLLVTVAAFAVSAHASAQTGTLRVIRVAPTGDAGPLQQISVTFDRPVAGSLDQSVDPATIFRIEPAVRGRLEWRDPVTIRLTPAAPLTPGAQYTVTLSNGFHAMDGSALSEPYRFTFRAHGPLLLTGSPVAPGGAIGGHVAPNQRFALVYSSAVDLATLSGTAYVELSATCGGQNVIRLEALSQRPVQSDDRGGFREAGGWERDRSIDSLRRVVQLAPRSPLPRGCRAELVLPSELTEQGSRATARWPFTTYGDLALESLNCADSQQYCPTGPLRLTFTNPVRGSEVAKRVRLFPQTTFRVRDTVSESTIWTLEAKLRPRVSYAVIADTALRDVFGQPLRGNPALGFSTTGYAPTIIHPLGHLLVERVGFRTLAVQHVNVDTLVATIAPVPDSLEPKILSRYAWRNDSVWSTLLHGASVQRLPVRAGTPPDRALITGIPMPVGDATRHAPSLFALRIEGHGAGGTAITSGSPATTVVQVTDLGVHAKIGATEGAVWVTGVSDGVPRAGATVVLHDPAGRAIATAQTNAQGLARFTALRRPAPANADADEPVRYSGFEGFVTAQLGADRAVVAINEWDPDLSPWRFNAYGAWGDQRLPLAGAVFTERGIYRPTERVYAKAIVRNGPLGALRAPAAGDSIKWRFHDREDGMLREVTVPLSAFGTSDQSLEIPAGAAVGSYSVDVQVKRLGKWRAVAQASYRIAEYRPPEFLIDLKRADSTRLPGEKLTASLQARYLFGAPMGRAVVSWRAQQSPVSPWEITIPGLDGWYVGETGAWWEEEQNPEPTVIDSKTDTLDARGVGSYSVTIPDAQKGRPTRVTIETTVTDVNRQAVGGSTSALVYPAELSVAAKPLGTTYFWRVGTPQAIGLLAVRPDGRKLAGITIQGTAVRREWHRVRRERDGVSELVGDWVSDTVSRCTVTSADTASVCTVTPNGGGIYIVSFKATDRAGRVASTSFERWVVGPGWVPWSDETQFKMDVIPDRARYAVGDTATVLFASPFTNAEAWITVEREGLIEQRRVRITSGSTTLKFPITEAFAPNAFVSILVARGRSAPPGSLDDGGRPTIRVGYAELRVTPEVKRLAVAIEPDKPEYRPADSAHVRVHVRGAQGHGSKSEVTLWAVDEGVLALTDYKTPDPIDLIYRERGLGMRLASNMTSVAPQIPEGEKGKREAGGGGGASGAEILRSRFKTTAFFLGSVVTDADGNATTAAKLPDNLTTFRIMAVAVTAADRYGKGESSLLVTRPLLARQALPRFVREGDQFTAGAVINRRDGAAATVTVKAVANGVTLRGPAERTTTLAALRGSEVRFPFQAMRGDSATFRFDVADDKNADAVQVKIPVRPDHHPVTHTIAGVLNDTASVAFALPAGIDEARSRLTLGVGISPLTAIRGMYEALRVYPYDCSEQVISEALPIIALYRLQPQGMDQTPGVDPRREIARAVAVLSGRQRSDGAIGYWSSTDWTSAWLSSYGGLVMLDARTVGVKVDTLVLAHLAEYLTQALHGTVATGFTPVASWYTRRDMQLRDQVAAVDFLSRFGRADVAAENELLRTAAQLSLEDRARLAEVLARRGQMESARRLMEATWAMVKVEGRRAVIPDSSITPFYFWSSVRPYAQILMATLALDANHPLIGPLAEAVVQQGRADRGWYWTTQDYGAAASALGALERRRRSLGDRTVRVSAGKRVLLEGGASARDSSVALQGLLTRQQGQASLRLALQGGPGEGAVYYYLTVTEIPSAPPVTPEEHGIRVERWYERFESTTPTTSVAEGDLVRVRLRLTVPTARTFVVLDDALPAGLEAVDLSLRTAAALPGPGVKEPNGTADQVGRVESEAGPEWYGMWDSGWWSPFDHREIRDDRVVYSAALLWPGTYTASYIARATTPGTFIKPPAHAEEMYNPAVYGRSDGGTFVVTARAQR